MKKKILFSVFIMILFCSIPVFGDDNADTLYIVKNFRIMRFNSGEPQYQLFIISDKDVIAIVVRKDRIDIAFTSLMPFIEDINIKFDEQPIEKIKLIEVDQLNKTYIGGIPEQKTESFIEKLKQHDMLLLEATTPDNVIRITPFQLGGFNDACRVLAEMIKDFSTIKSYLLLKGHF